MDKSSSLETRKHTIQRLQEARKESGLMQVEVAAMLSKPQSYISKIERGERKIDVAELSAFAKIYNKSLNYFIKQYG